MGTSAVDGSDSYQSILYSSKKAGTLQLFCLARLGMARVLLRTRSLGSQSTSSKVEVLDQSQLTVNTAEEKETGGSA